MARVEINADDRIVVVDDPNGQRADVARTARRLWIKTAPPPRKPSGFRDAAA